MNTTNHRSTSSVRPARRILAVGIAALLAAPAIQAAPIYWDGTSTDWSAVASWSTDPNLDTPDPIAIPGTGDVATFSISSITNTALTANLNADRSILGLGFLGLNAGTTTLLGGGTDRLLALGLSGLLMDAGAGAVTIGSATPGQNVAVRLNGNQAWANNSASLLTLANGVSNVGNTTPFTLTLNGSGTGGTTISGVISNGGATGTTAVTINTTGGTTTLGGANTFTGNLAVQQGVLAIATINNSAANGTLGNNANAVTLGATGTTGTLQYTGATAASTKRFTMGAGGTGRFEVAAPATVLTLSGVIDGTGALSKTGDGQLNLTVANTYTGATTIAAGTVNVQNATGLGTVAAGTTVAAGATLQLQNNITIGAEALNIQGTGVGGNGALVNVSGANTYQGAITLAGATTIATAAGSTLTLSGVMSGAQAMTKIGTGTLISSGTASTYTGATTISAGIMNIQKATGLGTTAGGTTVAGGATLQLQNNITVGTEALTIQGTGAAGQNGVLVNVSGTNSHSGTIALAGATDISSEAGTLTLSGVISGANTLNKKGVGQLILSGNNTYSAGTTLTAGILRALNGGGGANAPLGTGPLTLAAGELRLANGFGALFGNNTTVTGNVLITAERGTAGATAGGAQSMTLGTLSIGGQTVTIDKGPTATLGVGGVVFGNATLTGAPTFVINAAGVLGLGAVNNGANLLTIGGAGKGYILGPIGSGTGGVTKTGTGLVILVSGASSYTGTTSVTGGVLSVSTLANGGANSGLGAAASDVALGGGTLRYTGGTTATNRGLALSGTGGTVDISAGGTTATVGAVSGTGGFAKIGAGALTFAGTNTFTGATAVTGPLNLDFAATNTNKLDTASALTLNGATLNLLGGSFAQAVSATTLNSGASTIARTGSATLALNGLTRTAGATLNLAANNVATTTAPLTDGLFGGYATVGGADFATTSAGSIVALASYAGDFLAPANNVSLAAATAGVTTATVNSLRLAAGGSLGIGAADTVTLTSGGLLATGGTATTISGGTLRGSVGGELIVHQNNSGGLNISAALANNTSATGLTKTGNGLLILSGANSFTGALTVNQGTLQLDSATAQTATTLNGGTLETSDATRLAATTTLTLSGGSLRYTGSGAGALATAVTLSPITGSTFDVSSASGNLILSGVLSGGTSGLSSLNKTGAGTLTLTNNTSAFSGDISVSGGTLAVAGRDFLGNASEFQAITLSNGGAFQLTTGSYDLDMNSRFFIFGTGGGVLDVATGATLSVNDGSGNAGAVHAQGQIQSTAAANSLTKRGAGILNLGFNGQLARDAGSFSTFLGNIIVAEGTVTVGDPNGLGATSAGTTVNAGANLTFNQAITYAAEPLTISGTGINSNGALNISQTTALGGPITLAASASIVATANYSITSAIGESAPGSGLTKVGATTLTLTGTSNYTGATTVSGGTLIADTTTAATVLGASSALVLNAATFQLRGAAGENRVQILNGLTINAGSSIVDATNLGTSTTLDLRGAGAAGISRAAGGSVDFRATTGVFATDAVVRTAQANVNGILGGWATVNGGADLASKDGSDNIIAYAGYTPVKRDDSVVLNTTIASNAASNVRIEEGGGALVNITPAAGGTTNLNTLLQSALGGTNAAIYDPAATDILRLGVTGAIIVAPTAGALTIGNGYNDGILTAGGPTANAAGELILTNNSTNLLTIQSAITNNGSGVVSVTKGGANSVTLFGSNTYDGLTTVGAGILIADDTAALGSVLAGTVVNTGATLDVQQDIGVEAITVGGTGAGGAGALVSSTSGTVGGTVTLTENTSIGGSSALTVNGVIGGTFNLTKVGGGVTTLGGTNTYTGTTVISAGTLQVANGTAIPDGSAVSISNVAGAILDLASTNETIASITGGGATGGNVSLGSATLTIGTNNTAAISYDGIISGTGGLTKIGTGAQTLTRASTFSGNTLVSQGTLNVNTALALQNSALDTAGAGLVATNQTTLTLGGLIGSANLASVIATGYTAVTALTLNPGSAINTYSGIIANGAANMTLTKNGFGTQILSGANTYTGVTNINRGILELSGGNNRILATNSASFAGGAGSTATLELGANSQTLAALTIGALTGAQTVNINGAGGSLLLNGATDLNFGAAFSSGTPNTTIDMTALTNFSYLPAGATNNFRVGIVSGGFTFGSATQVSTVTLATGTNAITAANLFVGDQTGSAGGGASTLHLGTTNNLRVGNIGIAAAGRSTGTLDFATGLTNPTVSIRNTDGTSAVNTWNVGAVNTFSTAVNLVWAATVDLSAGAVDARVTTMTVGQANPGAGGGRVGTNNAAFTLGATTGAHFNVTTLNIGSITGTSTGAVGVEGLVANGAFTLNNATGILNANTINLATNTITATGAPVRAVSGTFNLDAGTLNATTLQRGSQTGGTATATTDFNWSGGTIGNLTGTDLAINNLPIDLLTGASHTFAISGSNTATVNAGSPITGATSALTKTGTGTLTLNSLQSYATLEADAGTTNVNTSFTGGTTTVNADAAVNFGASQTLAALNIGAGAVVTLVATPPFAPLAAGSAVVPEPGSTALLAGGLLTLLGLRRRR